MNKLESKIDCNFDKELQSLHGSLGFYIGYVSNSMRNAVTKLFLDNGYDITHAQWLILMMLWMKDGCRQKELTEIMFKEKTTITRLIDNLEKKGLLLRVPDLADKRNKFVYLTNSGKELKGKLTPLVAEFNKKLSYGLGDDELEELKKVLTKIHSNLYLN